MPKKPRIAQDVIINSLFNEPRSIGFANRMHRTYALLEAKRTHFRSLILMCRRHASWPHATSFFMSGAKRANFNQNKKADANASAFPVLDRSTEKDIV